jgi:DNA-binding NtrC family response regulator
MNTEILIIDDNFDMFDPLVIELKEHFPNANVTVQNNPEDGLNYILTNLSKKIIVLLDYNFKTGQPKGLDILLKIRKKTSLVYVIIMTAKQFSTIPHTELIDLVNNDTMAIVQNTVDTSEIINIVSKAEQQLSVRVDCVLEQWISNRSEDEQNAPYLTTTSGEKYTLKDILQHIRQQTDFGKKMERNIMMLAVDLLTRGKKQINDD